MITTTAESGAVVRIGGSAKVSSDHRLAIVISVLGMIPTPLTLTAPTALGPVVTVQAGLRYDVPLGSTALHLGPSLLGGWSGWSASKTSNDGGVKGNPLTSLAVVSPGLGLNYVIKEHLNVGLEPGTVSFFLPVAATHPVVAWSPSAQLGFRL